MIPASGYLRPEALMLLLNYKPQQQGQYLKHLDWEIKSLKLKVERALDVERYDTTSCNHHTKR